MKVKREIIIAYVPVLHEGYRRFFKKHKNAAVLHILDIGITREFVPLVKDIRALDPRLIRDSIRAWKIFDKVDVLNKTGFVRIAPKDGVVIMPDDEVMRELAAKYMPNKKIMFDTIFLRWDKHKSSEGKPIVADQTISKDSKDKEVIAVLKKESDKSSDWWRRIAAAVVKDGKIILITHNHTVPAKHLHYAEGDPRCDFHKGIQIELSTSFHAEAALVAEAARKGVSLEGMSMYVTTFPCPPCAKIVAYSGIKSLYYAGGYGVLDGERVLKAKGVKIIFVDTDGR